MFGRNLAATTVAAGGFPLGSQLGGTSVTVGGFAAPLLYVSPTQINLQIPSGVQPGNAAIQVNAPGGTSVGSGQGALDNPIADGAAAPSNPLARAALPVSVMIGGVNAPVAFAGMSPGFVGLFQVNVQIPNIYAGDQGMVVQAGAVKSDIFPIAIAPAVF